MVDSPRLACIVSTNARAHAGDWWTNYSRLQKSLNSHRTRWREASSPENADVILFTDSTDLWLTDVRSHPVYRQFMDRVFVSCEHDLALPSVPGVYTSIYRGRHNQRWTAGGFYVKVSAHDQIQPTPVSGAERYLGSFVGSCENHPVRASLLPLASETILINDVVSTASPRSQLGKEPFQDGDTYALTLRESAFILCPRGVAPSSYRIFEAMKAGRVPVVISDRWVPPVGPDWSAFSIQVNEDAVSTLPTLLESKRHLAPEMGALAASAYAEYFNADTCAGTILDQCLTLKMAINGAFARERIREYIGSLTRWQMLRSVVGPMAKRRIHRYITGHT